MLPNDAARIFEDEAPLRHVRQRLPHDSAAKHVQGAAPYIDDIPEPSGTLHVATGGAAVARGRITSVTLDAVRRFPGVVAVIVASDIPGRNDISPTHKDEPLLADIEILFHGQPVFAVVATTREIARRAARLGEVAVEAEAPSVTVEDALARNETVLPDYSFVRGDSAAAIGAAPHSLGGSFRIGGQEHFYLEGQVALAIPGEDGSNSRPFVHAAPL